MKCIARVAAGLCILATLSLNALAAAPEAQVLQVSITGAGAATVVDVRFRYRDADADAITIGLEASSDNGATWGSVPVATLTGDTTAQATVAWKEGTVRWAAGVDWPDQVSAQMRVRVVVQDEGGAGGYMIVDVSGGPDAASYPVTDLSSSPADLLTNDAYKTTKIVLRRIPKGTFTMGSPEGERGREQNETQHQVTLTKDFYICIFEITQSQYQNVTGAAPSGYMGAKRPVERVSWNDIRGGKWPGDPAGSGQPSAGTFIARLRAKTGEAFDLPTESQWEYACRAGTTTSLNSGTNITTEYHTCPNLNEVGRYVYDHFDGKGDYPEKHTTVGSYQPNAWGLYDMHGNVCEWCLDWHAAYPTTPLTDPLGGATGLARELRGGSWSSGPGYCRSARRGDGEPTVRYSMYGFRVVLRVAEEF